MYEEILNESRFVYFGWMGGIVRKDFFDPVDVAQYIYLKFISSEVNEEDIKNKKAFASEFTKRVFLSYLRDRKRKKRSYKRETVDFREILDCREEADLLEGLPESTKTKEFYAKEMADWFAFDTRGILSLKLAGYSHEEISAIFKVHPTKLYRKLRKEVIPCLKKILL